MNTMRGIIGGAVLVLALTACGGATQTPQQTPSSSTTTQPAETTSSSTCDAATEAILTGSEVDIKAAFTKLVADKTANKTAREYARSYLGPDAGPYGKDARDTDIALIQMACATP
jgi:hypothetical protein